jgi:hypothetical protein
MVRTVAALTILLAVLFFVGGGDAVGGQKNQMVKGTIKTVDTSKDVLIVDQKVKNESVERELSITPDTQFEVDGKVANGRAGLQLLSGKEGAAVNIKCDKDVNVLKVTVKGKK